MEMDEDSPRVRAARAGKRRYSGRACPQCKARMKYVCNARCVPCSLLAKRRLAARYREMMAGAAPAPAPAPKPAPKPRVTAAKKRPVPGANRVGMAVALFRSQKEAESKKENKAEKKKRSARGMSAAVPQPVGVADQTWLDFVACRRKVRAPITPTALRLIQAEATRAGWSLEAALRESILRGWRGFRADWVRGSRPTGDAMVEREYSEGAIP